MSAKAVLVLVVFLSVVRVATPARAQPAPPVSANVAVECPVHVAAIVARDPPGAADLGGRSYAALLVSPGAPGKATGKIWVNAGGNAFAVSFAHRSVISPAFAGSVDPIVFRLPVNSRSVPIDDAFVSELPAPGGGPLVPCSIAGVWTANTAESIPADVLRTLASASSEPVADADVIAAPGAACHAPDVGASVVTSVAPEVPPIVAQQGISGSVSVAVLVGADGAVAATRTVSSPSPLLDAAARTAARASVYRAAIVGCRPVASTLIVRTMFPAAFR